MTRITGSFSSLTSIPIPEETPTFPVLVETKMRLQVVPGSLFQAVGLVLALGGCGFDPAGDVPLDPPPVYREWWDKTQACSGLKGDFDRVRWSVIEGPSFPCSSGQCAGHWRTDHHIFLAGDWVMDEMVVRHEMLHDMIGRPGHPAPPFGQGCPLTWETWQGGAVQLEVGRHGSNRPMQID